MAIRYRVLLRLALAVAAGVLWVTTPLWLDWIETLTGWDPDQHGGSFERLLAGALLALTAIMLLLAAFKIRLAAFKIRRRPRPATAPPH